MTDRNEMERQRLLEDMAVSMLLHSTAIPMTPAVPLTAEVIVESGPALLRLAYVLTGSRSYAEDIVQDVYESALKKVGEPVTFPNAYLRTMVVNRVRTLGRRAPKDRVLVEDIACDDPREAELADALLKLRPVARTVLVLRYYEQWTVPEIARALHKPEGTVKAIVFRALRQLRKEFPNV